MPNIRIPLIVLAFICFAMSSLVLIKVVQPYDYVIKPGTTCEFVKWRVDRSSWTTENQLFADYNCKGVTVLMRDAQVLSSQLNGGIAKVSCEQRVGRWYGIRTLSCIIREQPLYFG